jgi:hypothetical protein
MRWSNLYPKESRATAPWFLVFTNYYYFSVNIEMVLPPSCALRPLETNNY